MQQQKMLKYLKNFINKIRGNSLILTFTNSIIRLTK